MPETSRTDDAGTAILHPVSTDVTVRVRRIGFGEQAVAIKLGSARRQRLRVLLPPVQTLSAVNVVGSMPMPADLNRRRLGGRGSFYGPEDLAKVQNARTLLARAPGATLEGSGIWAIRFRHPDFSGDCWADVYVDGRLTAPDIPSFTTFGKAVKKFEELDSYLPDAIYAIEVYPRASEAPISVVRLRDGCGAILVWTRVYAEQQLEIEQHRQSSAASDTSKAKR
jgi:hypothetical protein